MKEKRRTILWYNRKKEFYMQDFFQRYFDKLDLTTMLESLDQGDFSFDFVSAILYS